ncbi:hypothetical protein AIT68_004718 [Salmonella enterica subsp. salamae]|uniref:hypothetical protein n=1 Tax=Salmonella enterica TaxID=28901 RepID=UPI0009E73766|nr:hypothetical protein [Salmonella enterica]EBQ5245443.1 hypothetical protein [Salmonella enterica subsp. salamae]
MKLTVGDISFSASGPVNVFATVGVEPDQLPFPICTMNVAVPLVEGKALEQYKDELLEAARERIAKMYKEIVCGGEPGEAGGLLDYLDEKIEPSELGKEMLEQIKNNHSNNDLEGRVDALEKRHDEEARIFREVYNISAKAARDFMASRKRELSRK